jgi:ubiquinone/menaquinone biosynthesis C-methylase UbiE
MNGLPADRPLTVLDVAAGGTDLAAILRPLGRQFDVTALDINPLMAEYAKRRGHASDTVVGSALDLPYPDRSFDIVHVSLFLHHCTDAQVVSLLQQGLRIARLGIVVNDLQRHTLALSGITLLTTLFSRSPIVRNDAPASVRRAFTRREIHDLLSRAQIGDATLSWQWAFRWCISIRTDGTSGNG